MIIFINGASSSGKTQLAKALQEHWQGPLLRFSLDTVISQLPPRFTGFGEQATLGFPLQQVDANKPTHQVLAGPVGLQLNQHAAAYLAMLAADFDLVVDYVLFNKPLLEPFSRLLSQVPLVFVGLSCRELVLDARNAARKDRAAGLSVQQQRTMQWVDSLYDLRLDSSEASAQTLARAILAHVQENKPSAGFR